MNLRERLRELLGSLAPPAPPEPEPEPKKVVASSEKPRSTATEPPPLTENQLRILEKLQEEEKRIATQKAKESEELSRKQRAFELKAKEEANFLLEKIQESGLEETISTIFSALGKGYSYSAHLRLNCLQPIYLSPSISGRPLLECLEERKIKHAVLSGWGGYTDGSYSVGQHIDKARERWLRDTSVDSVKVTELTITLEWDQETHTEYVTYRSSRTGPTETDEHKYRTWKWTSISFRRSEDCFTFQAGDSQSIPETGWSQDVFKEELVRTVANPRIETKY